MYICHKSAIVTGFPSAAVRASDICLLRLRAEKSRGFVLHRKRKPASARRSIVPSLSANETTKGHRGDGRRAVSFRFSLRFPFLCPAGFDCLLSDFLRRAGLKLLAGPSRRVSPFR